MYHMRELLAAAVALGGRRGDSRDVNVLLGGASELKSHRTIWSMGLNALMSVLRRSFDRRSVSLGYRPRVSGQTDFFFQCIADRESVVLIFEYEC